MPGGPEHPAQFWSDDGPDAARINGPRDQRGTNARNIVNAGEPMVTAYHVLQRRFNVIAALFVRHIKKRNPVEIDRMSDMGMRYVGVQQNVTVTLTENV